MARRIQVLPDRLIDQIAAGEVVERPASVVKELVENALDAGATRVAVSVRNGGKTEICVADDGSGMGREDALLSLDRHATSKLKQEEDLAHIRTLGFRGEALPSIASVSRMVLETADRDGDGTRLVVSAGQLNGVESCARRRGTTVRVRSLFFNVPARAKFLRSAAAETRAISEVITTQALAHPRAAFSLESNGRPLLDLPPASEFRARVAAIWGDDLAETLTPVAHRQDDAVLSGLIQRPHDATPGSRRSYLFVNGRPFLDRFLVRAADRGYRTTVPPGVHPSLFLFLEVPDAQVDVNVHPTKAEVRFRDGRGIEQLVEEGVRAGLALLGSAPSIGARSVVQEGDPDPGALRGSSPPRPDQRAEPGDLSSVREGAGSSKEASQISLFVAGPEAEDHKNQEGHPGIEPTRPSMWQLHNTYILAETRSGLILVDQHSAHERVLFEELMEDFETQDPTTQRLLFPITLRLSVAEFGVVEELSGLFSRMGFEIEPFGGRSVIVHAVPNPHPYFDAERCLREMIEELAEGSELVDAARTQHQRIGLSYACKAAIKAGQRLSHEEITELFDRLFATKLPFHDIHGRPTAIQLSLRELHNRFGRHG